MMLIMNISDSVTQTYHGSSSLLERSRCQEAEFQDLATAKQVDWNKMLSLAKPQSFTGLRRFSVLEVISNRVVTNDKSLSAWFV